MLNLEVSYPIVSFLGAGTAEVLACTVASQYPHTLPSLSLALRRGLRLLPPSEEVPVWFGRP